MLFVVQAKHIRAELLNFNTYPGRLKDLIVDKGEASVRQVNARS